MHELFINLLTFVSLGSAPDVLLLHSLAEEVKRISGHFKGGTQPTESNGDVLTLIMAI